MSIVAVAGGQGDLGRLIVDALLKTGKHEVYILSRRVCILAYLPHDLAIQTTFFLSFSFPFFLSFFPSFSAG